VGFLRPNRPRSGASPPKSETSRDEKQQKKQATMAAARNEAAEASDWLHASVKSYDLPTVERVRTTPNRTASEFAGSA